MPKSGGRPADELPCATARPHCRSAWSLLTAPSLTSAVGYGLVYSTLDNNKNPTSGINVNLGPGLCRRWRQRAYFVRSAIDLHSYYEPISDLVSVVHLQAGDMLGLQKSDDGHVRIQHGYVSMLNDFKMGPNLVRGFAACRHWTARHHAVGTARMTRLAARCIGAPASNSIIRCTSCPRILDFTGAVFVDSGSVWGYKAETSNLATGEINGNVLLSGELP